LSLLSFSNNIIKKVLGKSNICSAVIMAAGSSKRMGGENKVLIKINDIPVVVHTLMVFQNNDSINEIIVVAREDSIEAIAKLCDLYDITKVTKIIAGGNTRTESVLNGITAVSKYASLIAIHDAARPCVDDDVIQKAINLAAVYKAAAPSIPITSTVKKVHNNQIIETVDRESLVEIQTPQVFNADLIKYAITKVINESIPVTDDCMAVELSGINVYTSKGSVNNLKITNKEDILVAQTILSKRISGEGETICE